MRKTIDKKNVKKSNNTRRIVTNILMPLFLFVVGTCSYVGILIVLFNFEDLPNHRARDYNGEVVRSRNELHMQGIKDQLVTAVDQYIQEIGPGSCVNGFILVDMCDKYDIDLKFALAQGHIESHFGTKGIASKTNSVFNVMSFDDLSAQDIIAKGKGYSHPDHSIEPYMKLLTTKYLIDKTEKDLFVEFVNINGERYASNKNYENQLLNIYEKIDSVVLITPIINEYRKYKIITK